MIDRNDTDLLYQSVDKVIEALTADIISEETALLRKKEIINSLCFAVGRPPAYSLHAALRQTEAESRGREMKSALALQAPQNTAKRMPNGDAALAGADTACTHIKCRSVDWCASEPNCLYAPSLPRPERSPIENKGD